MYIFVTTDNLSAYKLITITVYNVLRQISKCYCIGIFYHIKEKNATVYKNSLLKSTQNYIFTTHILHTKLIRITREENA